MVNQAKTYTNFKWLNGHLLLLCLICLLYFYDIPYLSVAYDIIYPLAILYSLFSIIFYKKKNIKLIYFGILTITIIKQQNNFIWKNKDSKVEYTYSILTFNVKAYKRGNYNQIRKEPYLSYSDSIKQWFEANPFDIMCLQEVSNSPELEASNYIGHLRSMGYKVIYFPNKLLPLLERPHEQGVAIATKFKVTSAGIVANLTNNNNQTIYADICTPSNDTLRVYCTHLQSYKLYSSKNILIAIERLFTNHIVRQNEIELLITHMAKSPYPTILTGDFNSLPGSIALRKIIKNYKLNPPVKPHLFYGTFTDFPIDLTLDYFVYSKTGLTFGSSQMLGEPVPNFSDHRPLYTKFNIIK